MEHTEHVTAEHAPGLFDFLPGIHLVHGLIGVGLAIVILVPLFVWRYRKKLRETNSQSIQNLQSEKNKSSAILSAINDGVVVIDAQNTIRLCNDAAAAILGWKAHDTLGIDYQSVIHFTDKAGAPMEAEADPINQTFATRTYMRSDKFMLTVPENNRIYISISVSPILSHNKEGPLDGVVVLFRDTTKEKSEEQQRADFISTASHEMRTPVAAIEGYLALALNDKVSSIDEKARGFLDKAHDSTKHLGKLFQDLLTSAKAEDGRLTNHPAVVEMGQFVASLTDDLKFAAQAKGMAVDFVLGAPDSIIDASDTSVVKPLYYVHVDPDRIREVITNLFDNAVKYSEKGKITLGLTGDNTVVQIRVTDTGPGIPASDLPHLFQKFYRVDNSATRTIGGTGLGLFICRKIVELYKGRIWVESEVGKGTTFFINLPRLSSEQASSMKRQEANQSPQIVTADTKL